MSVRPRLRDFQLSGLSEKVGVCASDTARCAALVNRVQERLMYCREAGDNGQRGEAGRGPHGRAGAVIVQGMERRHGLHVRGQAG